MPGASISNDVVIIIDGSHSFNRTMDKDVTSFGQTQKWAASLIKHLANQENAAQSTVTLVQFSGIAKLGQNYKPGNEGVALEDADLKHYKVEIAPTKIDNNTSELATKAENCDQLDGNGQLFLCLQDVSMKNFQDKITEANGSSNKKPTLIIVTDEDWDMEQLKYAPEFGKGIATRDDVCKVSFSSITSFLIFNSQNVHKAFDSIHAVIVRRQNNKINEDFIKDKLCKSSDHYYKVSLQEFEEDMTKAGKAIMNNMNYDNTDLTFF